MIPEGFIERARARCPEYEPKFPFSVYKGRCQYDWLREYRGITCDVPFVDRAICRTGNPDNCKEQGILHVPAGMQRFWKYSYTCKKCGRRYQWFPDNKKCECGCTEFERKHWMTHPKQQFEMSCKRNPRKPLKHKTVRQWFEKNYGTLGERRED